ncbi:MAG: MarC family protein [Candidatus Cybelea sp.]
MNVYVGGSNDPVLGPAQIFVALFVTLGPINFMKTFATLTRDAGPALQRQIAIRAAAIATISVLVSAVVGSFLLDKWHVSVSAVALSGAAVLFLVGMRSILELYAAPAPVERAAPSLDLALSPLAFPSLATPYGIAVLVVLLTLAPEHTVGILGLALLVMAIDLLMMLFIRPIMRGLGVPLSLLGVVLSLMQVALSIQFAFFAIRTLMARGV